MGERKSKLLFNIISPIYGLFYKRQKRRYRGVIDSVKGEIDINQYRTAVDIGCGTGALCSVLNEKGMKVTGIDIAKYMLKVARSKSENKSINFVQTNVLEGLPFDDNSFHIAFASYVAHGLKVEERKRVYAEMSRVAEKWVIIHDYNDKRSLLTSLIEWLEGGDYFNFIENPESEMEDCVTEMKSCFSQVEVINVGRKANWYICKPKR